jgi:cytochrome P450
MLFSPNHPDHPRLRQLIRQTLAKLGPRFAPETTGAVVRGHLAAAQKVGRVEGMEAVCRAIPTRIMTDALDLRPETVAAIRTASASIFAIYARGLPLRLLDALESDALAAEAAILEELAQARGGESGLAILASLNQAGFGFSDRTLAGYVFFLVLAGVETLTGLLGSMILLLHLHPDVRERVRADRSLVAPCVEEMIRYAGPMRFPAPRVALTDTELAGRPVRKGAILLVELEQAHHDPAAYDRPERLDPTREGPPNIGFGLGAHACLGAAIGRSEARIFLDAVLDGGPITPIDAEPDWEPHVSFRRLRRLDADFA